MVHPLHDAPEGFRTEVKIVVQDGVPVIAELHVFPTDGDEVPPRGLTASRLRDVRLPPGLVGDPFIQDMLRDAGAAAEVEVTKPRRHNRARISDDEVAQFAAEYVAATQRSTNPRYWLTQQKKQLGRWRDDETREWIRLAARRGYLTEAQGQGDRAPRQGTEQLRQWQEAQR